MAKSINDIFVPKPQVRIRIYAYSISDEPHAGLLKIGQTKHDVRKRVHEQLRTPAIGNYCIELDESAEKDDGSLIRDHDVRARLIQTGHEPGEREWVRCTVDDVRRVLYELRTGTELPRDRNKSFSMRKEQKEAVNLTYKYFKEFNKSNPKSTPRFLWNAKMRFGKTFTAYQLAHKMGAKRILVATFKPAVEDAWKTDIEDHKDFDGWQYFSKNVSDEVPQVNRSRPFVYFGSFQDLLGLDTNGKVKTKNRWLNDMDWDLVILDEYHFGAWKGSAQELFAGEDEISSNDELNLEYGHHLNMVNENLGFKKGEADFLNLASRSFLYLSGTPFRALANENFIEEQIFNWTYSDEQKAKEEFSKDNPGIWNPYAALPSLALFTYQVPEDISHVASSGEFNEFNLNQFFCATETENGAVFEHESDVQQWLNFIAGQHVPTFIDTRRKGNRNPDLPYHSTRLLPYTQHSFWFLPSVASCRAMKALMEKRHNNIWKQYKIVVAAGESAGTGMRALVPVRQAIGNGFDTKTITLSCGKLTTGVTVKQWSSILMLRNLSSPETYFQAAFRVQSSWSVMNPNGDDPNYEDIIKPVCFVIDFAPNRALRQISEYGRRLAPHGTDPEEAVNELISFLPVLAFDGAETSPINASEVLDAAISGTTAKLLARKWNSATLVNIDDEILQGVLNNQTALDAVQKIEGWRSIGKNPIETVISASENIKELEDKKKDGKLTKRQRDKLAAEKRAYNKVRSDIRDKLIKFATRIPVFMYLTDFRESTLRDVITELDSELFISVTGLSVEDFEMLLNLNIFNTERMDQAILAFKHYEDASLRYTGINSHDNINHYGLLDTLVEKGS